MVDLKPFSFFSDTYLSPSLLLPLGRRAHHRAQEKQSAVLGKRDAAALHREGNGGAKGGLDANPFVDASAAAAALDGANDGEQDAAARDAKRARTTKAA